MAAILFTCDEKLNGIRHLVYFNMMKDEVMTDFLHRSICKGKGFFLIYDSFSGRLVLSNYITE